MAVSGAARWRRGVAAVMAAGGLASWSAQPASAAPSGSSGAPDHAADVVAVGPERDDPVQAAWLAHNVRQPVEIASLRTGTRRVFANPDGTRTVRQYTRPQWVRRPAGWVPVDTTLRTLPDGSIAPVAAAADVVFSGGGTQPLISLSRGGARMALSWPGELPRPSVSADTATYVDVWPGTDLEVRAEVDGFSEVLVVKTAAAARNPALARVSLETSLSGVSLRSEPDGTIRAVDASGSPVFSSSGAWMWDKPVVPPDPAGGADAEARPAHETVIPVHVGAGSISVSPSLAMLRAADTTFPVYIDPAFSAGTQRWTLINGSHRDTSYWTSGYRNAMRVGPQFDTGEVWRTLMQFDVSAMAGTLVSSASLYLTLDHSASCTDSPVDLWQTNYIDPAYATTWNTMASKWLWGGPLQEIEGHANESGGCGVIQPDDAMEFGGAALLQRVRDQVGGGNSTMTFGLRVPDEGDRYQWMKFLPDSVHLDVRYNRLPNAPTALAITDCYLRCDDPAVVRNLQATLSAKVSDPDGDVLRAVFEVWSADYSTLVAYENYSVTGRASGSTASWQMNTPRADDTGYHFRARACDDVTAGDPCGPWSGWFTFTTQAHAPGLPAASAAVYDLYQPPASGAAAGGIGVPDTFTFDPNGAVDVVQYVYAVDDGTPVTVPAAGSGLGTATITPVLDGVHKLSVRSRNAAGLESDNAVYYFRVAAPASTAAVFHFDDAAGLTATNEIDATNNGTLSPSGATWINDGHAGAGAVHFDGTAGMVTDRPVLSTTNPAGYTVTAWVRASGLGTDFPTVLSQQGAHEDAFQLQYRSDQGPSGAWCFTMRAADVDGSGSTSVCSSMSVVTGDWVFLAGQYDPQAQKIRIFVNGDADLGGEMREAAYTAAPWQAGGPFVVGRGLSSGAAAFHFAGDLDEVQALQRVATADEIDMWALQ